MRITYHRQFPLDRSQGSKFFVTAFKANNIPALKAVADPPLSTTPFLLSQNSLKTTGLCARPLTPDPDLPARPSEIQIRRDPTPPVSTGRPPSTDSVDTDDEIVDGDASDETSPGEMSSIETTGETSGVSPRESYVRTRGIRCQPTRYLMSTHENLKSGHETFDVSPRTYDNSPRDIRSSTFYFHLCYDSTGKIIVDGYVT